jgi:hypothetical protein
MLNALGTEHGEIGVYKALPAAPYAHALDIERGSRAHNCADRRVHTGRIAAAREHAYALYFFVFVHFILRFALFISINRRQSRIAFYSRSAPPPFLLQLKAV